MQGRPRDMDSSRVDGLAARQPLVSVGIPTFNRPEGLRRTLRLITSQTYRNLEILISDNASPGPETEKVVRDFSATDARIIYFRQPANIGAIANFRFVLAKASGEYFMWAADDDEWDARFIETCLAAAGTSCSVMTKFHTIFRAQNTRQENPVPTLSPDLSLPQNVISFFANMQPSLFYGLHPRKSVLFTLKGSYFDFYDCYVVLRIILESGFRTIDCSLYGAGVDTPSYEVKYANAKNLKFWPFFLHSSLALVRSSRLSMVEKCKLWLSLLQLVRRLRHHHAP
ncbi:glycosyltransferase family 2 protein [Bradyrhizobium vignae]|uniref:Glycosyltransferase family 2 protein n=1 Tax=Bradyrhizobium vignae TaxID=1549949 RepID=A0ABS3ZYR5_9BRAD|nr:glycosyltransferase family 2 protein [Bradyrhizobium vignae]MBP0113288.1 glycosyltransferase family 2 protein [Bradyrhizobium vignae]